MTVPGRTATTGIDGTRTRPEPEPEPEAQAEPEAEPRGKPVEPPPELEPEGGPLPVAPSTGHPSQPIGTFCLVLHTHLPWVAHAGAWPVGEEWLHQAFTGSWRRLLVLLEEFAGQGRREVLTLGVTPITAAMLDDPYCLSQIHTWAGFWQARAQHLADRGEPWAAELAEHEFRAATDCLADLEARWLTGGLSSVLRPLVDAGVVELLSGPATHPFLPLLGDRTAKFALQVGLDDARIRLGRAPEGIWAPECGYRSGLEQLYATAGVRRFLCDGPALHGDTAAAHPVGESDVVVFGRDLDVTYQVWSPKSGYPGGRWYRDFHAWDHASGFRAYRVTSRRSDRKAPYRPDRAMAAVADDAANFAALVRQRLLDLSDRHGRPAMVVAAYDTELFGHHWFEGPEFLRQVLRLLPEAGVRVTTLAGALDAGHLGGPVTFPDSSWGSGKDFRVWEGTSVADLVSLNSRVERRLSGTADAAYGRLGRLARQPALDQLAREALLTLASDWAFMVTKDSSAEYARVRAATHSERFDGLADLIDQPSDDPNDVRRTAADGAADRPRFGSLDQDAVPPPAGSDPPRRPDATAIAETTGGLRRVDGPFGHLDTRLL